MTFFTMCYDYEDARASTLPFGIIISVISANARCYVQGC